MFRNFWIPPRLIAALIAAASVLNIQDLEAQQTAQRFLEPEVTFLVDAPIIDGVLDHELASLPRREFPHVIPGDSSSAPIPAHYRLAYGADFLYVYVEAGADRLVYNDRAYQNGDGFAMVIAIPRPDDAPTEEFYVLACSAVQDPRLEWTRRVFWYYNVVNIFQRTSEAAKLQFHDGNDTIGFELYLPWRDVHPNHPWLSAEIGFNLRFVKATANGHLISYQVHPGSIGAENSPRTYVRLRFQEPLLPERASRTYVQPERGNITEGSALKVTAVTAAGDPVTEDLVLRLRSGEGSVVASRTETRDCDAGLCRNEVALPTADLVPGDYLVEWQSRLNSSRGASGLTVLPGTDLRMLRSRLAQSRQHLAIGSAETIEFLVTEVESALAAVRPYETAARQRAQLTQVEDLVQSAEGGRDAIAERRQFVRRAYRSRIDSTLQPYVVWIPPDFDPTARYPLLVFLHGSASTERNIIDLRRVIPEGFIAVGPYGRGPSNAWSWDGAQADVAEVIDAVAEHYPIDEERIVLSGFSMGGYGVYRTYLESPEKFRALVVLSGSPNLANRWSGTEDYPDFTTDRYIRVFRNVPVFVFHGRRDRNVPFEATQSFVMQLREIGAEVEFVVEDGAGHSSPGQATIRALHDWIMRILEWRKP